ncbi:MAG: hypothetical protein ABIR32_09825 [Ilumatobacteraceae bacterium]
METTVGALGPFDTPIEEADAHRHVLRLTSAALDLFVERADPARPLPTEWMSPTRKFLGDTVYTVYTTVPVSATHRYRSVLGSAMRSAPAWSRTGDARAAGPSTSSTVSWTVT